MRILVTGGTGYVGSNIVRHLIEQGHPFRCLVRPGASIPEVDLVEGDVVDPESLPSVLDGCDTVIHLVGIIEEAPSKGITFHRLHAEATRNLVEASKAVGVKTFVHMSANGARADGISDYQTSKWEAEEAVREAGFESATIFRPSLVFGRPKPGRREFSTDLLNQLIRPFPVLPIFGDGKYEFQPVSIENVVAGFVSAAVEPKPRLREYCVGSVERLSYVEIVDRITKASGRSVKPKIHIPTELVRAGIAMLGWTGLLPITMDQFEMLLEGNTCSADAFYADFGLEPVPFNEQTLDYVRKS